MRYLIKNASVYSGGGMRPADVLAEGERILRMARELSPAAGDRVIDARGAWLIPGLVDVHVHFREPGFSYKETILSGSLAAARGGYTAVCAMPNLAPVPDCLENLEAQTALIARDARVRVLPYGAITRGERGGELSDMAALAPHVAGFSDDGRGVQSDEVMRAAMREAACLGKIIAAHCEDTRLIPPGGCAHAGAFARENGLAGIPSESEWRQLARDLALVRETGCKYHACHLSAKESVALVRRAKAEGLDVTCETAPHYLLLEEGMLRNEGRFKMNPPIRAAADRAALIEGLRDGTIDMIATDHAPHAAHEKAGDFTQSLMGVTGLECAFAALYTALVLPGTLTLVGLLRLMHDNPARRFGLGEDLAPGARADLAVFAPCDAYPIDPQTFASKGKSTPFAGAPARARCLMTMVGGEIVWNGGLTGNW